MDDRHKYLGELLCAVAGDGRSKTVVESPTCLATTVTSMKSAGFFMTVKALKYFRYTSSGPKAMSQRAAFTSFVVRLQVGGSISWCNSIHAADAPEPKGSRTNALLVLVLATCSIALLISLAALAYTKIIV